MVCYYYMECDRDTEIHSHTHTNTHTERVGARQRERMYGHWKSAQTFAPQFIYSCESVQKMHNSDWYDNTTMTTTTKKKKHTPTHSQQEMAERIRNTDEITTTIKPNRKRLNWFHSKTLKYNHTQFKNVSSYYSIIVPLLSLFGVFK